MKIKYTVLFLILMAIICFGDKANIDMQKNDTSLKSCAYLKCKENTSSIHNVNRYYTNSYSMNNNQFSGYNNQSQNTSGTKYPKVTLFEKQLFSKSYENENIYNRLGRIENQIFGRINSQSSLVDRVENIEKRLQTRKYLSQSDASSYSNHNNLISAKDISTMENRLFGRTYQNDDVVDRMERLEQNLFGAIQSGDIKKRMERLKIASQRQYLSDFSAPTFMQYGQSYSQSQNGDISPYYNNQNYNSNYSSSGLLDYVIPMIMNKLLNFNNSDDGFFSPFGGSTYSQGNYNRTPYGTQYRNSNDNYATGVGVTILND